MSSNTGYKPLSHTNFPGANKADTTRASAMNDARFQGQEDSLQNAKRTLQRDRDQAVNVQREMGDIHTDRIGEISNLLQSRLSENTGRVQDVYAGASQLTGDAYQRAADASRGASSSVMEALQDSMRRLGLEAAGRDPISSLEQLMTDQSATNELSRAGAVGNVNNLGADLVGLMTKGESDAAQEWAGRQDEFGRQVQGAIAQIDQQFGEARLQILQELSSLQGTRGSQFVVDLMETIDARLERERQARMDALQEEIQRGQLAVARGQLGVQQRAQSLRERQHRDALAAAEAEANRAQTPMEQLEALHRVTQLRSEIQQMQGGGQAAGGAASGERFRGQSGVEALSQQRFGNTAGPVISNAYNQIRNQAAEQSLGIGLSEDEVTRGIISQQPANIRQELFTLDNAFRGNW